MKLGEKIYTLRTKKNLSQGDLAELLEVSRQSVSKWENGLAQPDLDKVVKLCEIFEISVDEFIKGELPFEELDPKKEEAESEAPAKEENHVSKKKGKKLLIWAFVLFAALICIALTAESARLIEELDMLAEKLANDIVSDALNGERAEEYKKICGDYDVIYWESVTAETIYDKEEALKELDLETLGKGYIDVSKIKKVAKITFTYEIQGTLKTETFTEVTYAVSDGKHWTDIDSLLSFVEALDKEYGYLYENPWG